MSPESARKRFTPKRLIMIAVPLVVLAAVVAVGMGRRKEPTYFTAAVERGDIMSIVQATGTINAVTTVQVGSQVSGNIQALRADFNSRVKKGQIIAELEPSLFKARLQQATADLENAKANIKALEANIEVQKADLASSKANVDKARATANQAKLDLNRALELFQQGIVATAQRDTAQSNYDAAAAGLSATEAQVVQSQARLRSMSAQLEQGKAQVAQREAAVDAARVDVEHAVIYAPIDGTVVARNVDVGQTVAASLQAPTLFTIAQDLTQMLVYVKTDESDVGNVRVGARATFKVDAFPNETFVGQVKEVRINPQTVQNVVTYDTVIAFSNPDQKLLPGMTAYVTIPVAMARDTIKIPNGALRFRPDISDDERRALLQKAGIGDSARRGMAPGGPEGGQGAGGGAAGGQGGGRGTGSREGTGAGRPGGGGGTSAGGGRPGGGGQGGAREGAGGGGMGGADIQIVWKLDANKKMVPVQVRAGITDFTFTQLVRVLKGGELKDGELLVTGMTNPNRVASMPAGMPGAFGRPSGRR
jgi:HlyD family secretion protein